jgi:voltage-gated potassium channel
MATERTLTPVAPTDAPTASAGQRRVHALLDGHAEAGDPLDVAAYWALLAAIVAAVALMVLETVPSVAARWGAALAALDLALGVLFLAEYVARVWSAPAEARYADGWRGRLRYVRSPMALLDLVAVAALLLPHLAVDLRQARLVRLFALLRVGKLGRAGRASVMLYHVVASRRADLVMAAGVVASLLLVGSTLVFFVEHDAQPDKFGSIPEAMWWGAATVTTVGYGDVYPVTAAGRVLGACLAMLGIASFALPTAILGAAFLEELQRQRAQDAHAPCPTCGRPPEPPGDGGAPAELPARPGRA